MKSVMAHRPPVVDIACKIALVTPQKKVLLIRRSKTATYRPLQWDLPGGKWDGDGNELRQTIYREAMEELGTQTDKQTMQIILAVPVLFEGGCTLAIGFTQLIEEFVPRLSYEHDQYAWVTKPDLVNYPLVPSWQQLTEQVLS